MIDLSAATEPLFAHEQQRTQGVGRFRRIIDYLEATDHPPARNGGGYNRLALIRLTFDYARSQESQDRFLAAFFQSLAVGMLDDGLDLGDDSVVADFRLPVLGFAEFLMANIFLPGMRFIIPASISFLYTFLIPSPHPPLPIPLPMLP